MHKRIGLLERNAKSPRLKSNLEMDFAAAVYLFEAVVGKMTTFDL
jgi:hypothetical protein